MAPSNQNSQRCTSALLTNMFQVFYIPGSKIVPSSPETEYCCSYCCCAPTWSRSSLPGLPRDEYCFSKSCSVASGASFGTQALAVAFCATSSTIFNGSPKALATIVGLRMNHDALARCIFATSTEFDDKSVYSRRLGRNSGDVDIPHSPSL